MYKPILVMSLQNRFWSPPEERREKGRDNLKYLNNYLYIQPYEKTPEETYCSVRALLYVLCYRLDGRPIVASKQPININKQPINVR